MNKITTYIGSAQRPLTLLLMYILINPHALDSFLSVTAQQYVMKITAAVIAFIGFYKDTQIADAKTVTDLIKAVPLGNASIISPLADMKAAAGKVALMLVCCFFLQGCAAIGGILSNPQVDSTIISAVNSVEQYESFKK